MNQEKIKDYLYDCRWCNFKEDIKQGRVEKITFEKIPYDNNQKLFIIGEAEITGKEKKYFSMPLAKKAAMPEDEKVIILDGEIYVDALKEPDFWKTLMAFINEHNGKVELPNGWSLEYLKYGDQTPVTSTFSESSKALGVEQSNTTLNIGNGSIAFKLERMLEFSTEINSELEMNEKLMREGCTVMPKSYGGLIWKTPDGLQASAGIMQEFVKNRGDMWNCLLGYIDYRLPAYYMYQRELTAENNPKFIELISNLSQKTKEMGECLQAPDDNPNFTPEKVDEKFIAGYEKQIKVLSYQVKRTITEHLEDLPLDTRQKAEALLENWDERLDTFISSRLDKIRNLKDKGTLNRVHGDFHLGQVMVTPQDDLKFIDFAGEPDLPMTERKKKHLSVRDIAGMYRSIKGYLGAVAVENFAAHSEDSVTAQAKRKWAERALKPLIDEASKTFLGEHSMNEPWLALEVLRKNLYEVKYEVGNRPNMAYVPINGLTDILGTIPGMAANENIIPGNGKAANSR